MIKIASYCRVSTDKDDQANSFENQQSYFREYVAQQPDWELYRIYADEGITGTSTKKRIQFNRMIHDAYEGKFQLIITKEVSRFSRNILDTISYTRDLRAIGVGVLFVTDRINTLEPDAEMLLSFLASLAQEESRRISTRVVWGQTRQMENGVVFGQSLLGYDVKEGKISVNPEGAEIVRMIFQKYAVEQVGTSEIAKLLTREGYHTYRGNHIWKPNAVVKILKNEKYVGDLVQKKTYTPDFLNHEKRSNKGAVPLIRIENHHEPIVSREVWNRAQERLQFNNKHSGTRSGHSNRYIFSGKIKCGECGSSFVGRFKYLKDGTKIRRWCCGTVVLEGADACDVGKLVRDDDAMQMLKTALRSLSFDKKSIIKNVTTLTLEAIQVGECGVTADPIRLRIEMNRLQQKREAVMDSYFSKEISKADMQTMKDKYENQMHSLSLRLSEAELRNLEYANTRTIQSAIEAEILSILSGETESDGYFKAMLHSLTVFKDRHMELRLNYLPQVFWFSG